MRCRRRLPTAIASKFAASAASASTVAHPVLGAIRKSGEKVQVPEKFVPHFKPGKELRERVDGRAGEPLKSEGPEEPDDDM